MVETKQEPVDLGSVDRSAWQAPLDRRVLPELTHHGQHCDLGRPVPVRGPFFLGTHIACRPMMFSYMRRGADEPMDNGRGCV